MADPNAEEVAEDAPITPGACAESPDEQGDDEYMDDEEKIDDNEPTLRWSARTSAKRPIIASPPRQPLTQRPKVDYLEGISILSNHPIRPLILCLSENVVLATRGTWSVSCLKIQWQWPALTAHLRSSNARCWPSGLMNARSRRPLSWQLNRRRKLQRRPWRRLRRRPQMLPVERHPRRQSRRGQTWLVSIMSIISTLFQFHPCPNCADALQMLWNRCLQKWTSFTPIRSRKL